VSQVIAIDGPAASGKSTVANRVSETLGIPYINTGNMYRTVTFYLLSHGIDPLKPDSGKISSLLSAMDMDYRKAPDGVFRIYLNNSPVADSDIRSPEVTALVSPVAAMPEVRARLLELQRHFASLGLIVMEGRDIGTVIFPDAEYKFFVTATPYARAMRRLNQGGETPENSTVQEVADQIAERDRIDSTRAVAPLKQADDATFVDTTNMTIVEVVEFITSRVKQ